MVPPRAGQLRKKRAGDRMARFRGKTYWAYSIGCAMVWAVVLAIFLTLWASETRPLLLGMFGWWICWVSTTISRYAFPPPKRWMANPSQTVNPFRTYWVYSGSLVIAWAVMLTLARTILGGLVAQTLVFVFDGFCLGWFSTTIARYGYPPPKRWTSNERHAPTA